MLNWKTISSPVGCIRGIHFEWEIKWLPPDAPNGFVIQRIEAKFDLRSCEGKILSENEIWSRFGFTSEPRLKYWEAWQVTDGHWLLPAIDKWGCNPNSDFFNIKTSGTWFREGRAAFYEGVDLMKFGDGWGKNGQNSGSPASGDLMSTIEDLSLPYPPTVYRKMELSWNSCGDFLQNVTKIDWYPKDGS